MKIKIKTLPLKIAQECVSNYSIAYGMHVLFDAIIEVEPYGDKHYKYEDENNIYIIDKKWVEYLVNSKINTLFDELLEKLG